MDTSCCETGVSSSQVDCSRGLTDRLGAQTDAPSASNRPETVVVSHSDSTGTYLGVRDTEHLILEMDGTRDHMDTSNRLTDVPSVETNMTKPENTTRNVRSCQVIWKTKNSPNGHEIATLKPIH